MPAPSPPAGPVGGPPRRRAAWRAPLALLPPVLLAHGVLLGLLPVGVGPGSAGDGHRALQVRRIVTPAPSTPSPPVPQAPALALAPAPAPAPEAAPEATERPPPSSAPTVAARAPAVARAAPVALAPAPDSPAAERAPASGEPDDVAPAVAAAPPTPETGGADVPVYATRLPAPVRLSYELRRGALAGSAEIVWRDGSDGYELSLEGSAFALSLIRQTSRGHVDAAGLAPDRFVDSRRGRDLRAANFQRDKGLISFSGPSIEYPLVPGAQDRLSWMVQLPAIVAADPARFGVGTRITMFVAGARGEGDLWTFRVEARETIELPLGTVADALRLRREPRRPYDTLAEVWLDPAHDHLAVRARLSTPQTGDATEFRLRALSPP